jgi:hypothetical protein
MIDIHVHINDDDARPTIEYVVDCAARQGISALGIVVHDYVGHMEKAVLAGRARGIESFAVTELSAKDGHYLMFFPDCTASHDAELNSRLSEIYDARRRRLENISVKLQKNPYPIQVPGYGELLFSFSMEDLKRISRGGRMLSGHLSQLVSEKTGNAVAGRKAYALLKGILSDGDYCCSEEYSAALLSVDELVHFRDRFGAVLVEAHPEHFDEGHMRDKLAAGVDGFEISVKLDLAANREILASYARQGFILTVGSDNHLWESETLGLRSWQPELVGEVDEKKILDALSGRLNYAGWSVK